jgi:hypothetical protein
MRSRASAKGSSIALWLETRFPVQKNQPATTLSSHLTEKPGFPRLLVSERNPVLLFKSKIIMLSGGKTGFLVLGGFLCKQTNPQKIYLLISPKNQVHHDFSSSRETRF